MLKSKLKLILLFAAVALAPAMSMAQVDPLEELEMGMETEKDFQINTFGSTRVINAHSTETQPKGSLDFRISHRFGPLNDGAYGFFGLDRANMRLAFEYGATDRLLVGIGRSNVEKTFDGLIKYKIIWQAKGGFPFTLDYLTAMTVKSLKPDPEMTPYYFTHRLTYTHQIILARKFGKMFSLELLPTYIHRNLVVTSEESNDVYAIGAAGRLRLNNIFYIDAEYFYLLPGYEADTYKNSFGIGLDIKVGSHEFQLAFSNSLPMTENGFIAGTTESWLDGGIHFGFNLSRVFDVGPHFGKNKKH